MNRPSSTIQTPDITRPCKTPRSNRIEPWPALLPVRKGTGLRPSTPPLQPQQAGQE